MLCIFQLNLRWRIERESMKSRIFVICLRLSYVYHSFIHWILVISFNSLESCMFIQLCSLTFFSFSAYAEVWHVRLDWMLQQRLSLAWRSHIWFHSLILCELDLSVNLNVKITNCLRFAFIWAFDSLLKICCICCMQHT